MFICFKVRVYVWGFNFGECKKKIKNVTYSLAFLKNIANRSLHNLGKFCNNLGKFFN